MKLIQLSALLLFITFYTSCGVSDKEEMIDASNVTEESSVCQRIWTEDEIDYHTLSNYMDVYVSHIHLDVEISFAEKKLFGSATHTIENPCNKDIIVFDSRSLDIASITLNEGEEATYEIGDLDELLGQSITVHINENTESVTINYSTTKGTRALDWLAPAQTADKQNPFMYTQGQAVLTRTWLPCQDTPGRRITYSAKIKVPSHLMAVMSASNPTVKNETGIYDFEMNQSIPTYLMAIAVGDLEFVEIDERTGVYSEPSMIEACRYEFGDMGKMVDVAEGLYGEYQWERYDVIVLPPSFPFGGMENPRLTFATPTIIAGDRSLTTLVAHELAHSWSGNLVTNSNWNDFWLNEGFTMYFERRIMEELYGKDYVDMLALLGYQDLLASISSLEPKMQMLKLKMKGLDPDEAMTDIAYEKGYSFLRLIEDLAGREKFDVFIKDYFSKHKFQTMTTEVFLAYLKENLLEPNNIEFNFNEWIYESGLPENCIVVVSERFNSVEAQLTAFYETNDVSSVTPEDWSTHEWLHFIRHFKPETTIDQMAVLDDAFHLTQSGNSEIAAIWFEKSINAGYNKIDDELEAFLIRVGRRKFLQPLYNALAATPEGKQKGLDIYVKARDNYHFVSVNTIDAILGYSPS